MLATVAGYVSRLVSHDGSDGGDDGGLDKWADQAPALAGVATASVQGFDLHAGLRVPADQRDRLERVCRYALRPPVAHTRLHWTDDGHLRLDLRRPWSDGTTHLLFDPVELLERLAVLIPRPRINLILYHGVLAPRGVAAPCGHLRCQSRSRRRCRIGGGQRNGSASAHGDNYLWAALMRRSLGLDVLACPGVVGGCGSSR